MGQTGGESNSRSGSLTAGLLRKDLKLTVIFAPCSRCELLDIYNPIEFPTVDRQMRVISKKLEASNDYVPEQQDKVIYINCDSITGVAPEVGPPLFFPKDMMDKLKRAIQLIHELLDYWHGYYGTVFTNFCCYEPLQGLMVALQSILGCPGGISAGDTEFVSNASAAFSDALEFYYEWTFVNKHSSVYRAQYKYEVYNDKSDKENLLDANEKIIDGLKDISEEAWSKFRDYYDATGTDKTTKMYGVEGYISSHPEYEKFYYAIRRNNEKIREIDEKNKKFAEEWGKKSHGQRLGYVKQKLDKQYDPQINAVERKYQPYLDEISEKLKQLDWQQGKKSQFTPEHITQRAFDAYKEGVELHGAYHTRDRIEYNGEYRNKDELLGMYNMMKMRMKADKKGLESKKEKAWRQARDDIRKQINKETFEAGLAIMNIYAIVLAPLALVDILVITYELAWTEKEFDASTLLSLALDVFGLVPFIGAMAKGATGVGAIVVNDLSKQGLKVAAKGADDIGGLADGLIKNADNFALDVSDIRKTTGELNTAKADYTAASEQLKSARMTESAELRSAEEFGQKAQRLNSYGYSYQERAIKHNAAGNEVKGAQYEKLASASWKGASEAMEEALTHEVNAEFASLSRKIAAEDVVYAQNAKRVLSKTLYDQKRNLVKNNLLEANQLLTGSVPGLGGASEVIQSLPVISLGGYVKDLNLYLKNFSNMTGKARVSAAMDLANQTVGHVGTYIGGSEGYKSLTSDPAYTVQTLGEDFILIVKN